MSKNWYPIVNYDKCTGCLSCVEFCPHGVLSEKDGYPFADAPENCVEFCRGCQKGACDFGAISYFGDEKGKEVMR